MKSTPASLVPIFVLLLLVLFFAGGCASPGVSRPARPAPKAPPVEAVPPAQPSPPSVVFPEPESPSPPPPPRTTRPPEPTPRMVASLRLTEEARILLESGKTDQAIRTLEKAMNMSPSNGQNFYYLSEAWLMKKNTRQAEEFNRLAALYLKNDPQWASKVAEQEERIRRSKQ